MTGEPKWLERRTATVGDTDYDVSKIELDGITFEASILAVRPSTPEAFSLQKSEKMITTYLDLVRGLPARNVVELGIFQGGSTALFGLLPETEKVVAIEFDDNAGGALDTMIEARGLGDTIHTNYGTDQSDHPAVVAAVEKAGITEIDLVIDDASHRYAETLASFETLFPRVRPGGVYIIEDWRWAHIRGVGLGAEFAPRGATSLTTLAFELTMICGGAPEVVDRVSIGQDMITVVRGDADLPLEGFRIRDHYDEISADLLGDWSASD